MKTILISDDDLLVGKLQIDGCDLLISLGDLWEQTLVKATTLYEPKHALAVRGNHDRPGYWDQRVGRIRRGGKL
jgi:predicted phosphodiesterase